MTYKKVIFGIYLLGIASVGQAALAIGRLIHPDHPGKCFVSNDTILSPGEMWQVVERCAAISCHNDSSIDMASCGVRFDEEMKLDCPDDYVRPPYPDCCNDLVYAC